MEMYFAIYSLLRFATFITFNNSYLFSDIHFTSKSNELDSAFMYFEIYDFYYQIIYTS